MKTQRQGIDGCQNHVKLLLKNIAHWRERGVELYHPLWECVVIVHMYIDIVVRLIHTAKR